MKNMIWKTPQELLGNGRIWMITGNYGSGKTELALNLALHNARTQQTTLVDLDIVNPYFRSAEQTQMLTQAGVKVLMPTFAMSTVDIPALPAEIVSAFYPSERQVIFDVGGDDTGAAALGRYKPQVDSSGAKMMFVINARRPLTQDAQSILELISRIENRARMKVSLLVNNTNLGRDTTPEDILWGKEITQQVAQSIPCEGAFHGVAAHLLDQMPQDIQEAAFPITPYMRPEWLDDSL